jgi:hypothetical protein
VLRTTYTALTFWPLCVPNSNFAWYIELPDAATPGGSTTTTATTATTTTAATAAMRTALGRLQNIVNGMRLPSGLQAASQRGTFDTAMNNMRNALGQARTALNQGAVTAAQSYIRVLLSNEQRLNSYRLDGGAYGALRTQAQPILGP